MKTLLEKAGLSALRAFIGSIIIFAPGVLAAPDLSQAYLLGVAALVASIAAALKALQVFAPQISFASILPQPTAAWVDSFTRAFVGTLLTLSIGILNAPDFHIGKAAIVAVLVGAVTAGIRALQGLFTKGEAPAPGTGV